MLSKEDSKCDPCAKWLAKTGISLIMLDGALTTKNLSTYMDILKVYLVKILKTFLGFDPSENSEAAKVKLVCTTLKR